MRKEGDRFLLDDPVVGLAEPVTGFFGAAPEGSEEGGIPVAVHIGVAEARFDDLGVQILFQRGGRGGVVGEPRRLRRPVDGHLEVRSADRGPFDYGHVLCDHLDRFVLAAKGGEKRSSTKPNGSRDPTQVRPVSSPEHVIQHGDRRRRVLSGQDLPEESEGPELCGGVRVWVDAREVLLALGLRLSGSVELSEHNKEAAEVAEAVEREADEAGSQRFIGEVP